jgi:MFS family permease
MNNRSVAILIAGFFTVFVGFSVRYAYGLLLPQMISSLAISKAEAGIIFSSYFLTYTIFSPLLGLLADRFEARRLLTLFVALLGLGANLMSISTTINQACLFFALAGIGHSACWAPVVAVVQRWVSEKRRGTAIAIVDLGSTCGIAFGSMLMPFIVETYSWRAGWVSLGLLAFLAAGLNFFIVRSYPPVAVMAQGSIEPPLTHKPIKEVYRALFCDNRLWIIGFSYLLISFSILIPFAFLVTYVNQELQMPYKHATGLIAVIAVAGIFGKLVLSHFSDFVGRIKVMILCGVFTATGGLGLAFSQGFSALVVFATVFGIGFGAIWPVYAASARDYFSPEHSGSVVGLWTLFLGVGSMLSPVIAGWTIDATGRFVWAFVLSATSSAVSLLLLLPLAKAPGSR